MDRKRLVMYRNAAPEHFRHKSIRAPDWDCSALTWSRDNTELAWECDDCGYKFGMQVTKSSIEQFSTATAKNGAAVKGFTASVAELNWIEAEGARLTLLVQKRQEESTDVCIDCAAEFCFELDQKVGIGSSLCAVCPTGAVCHKCAPQHTCFVNGKFIDTAPPEPLAPRRRTVVFDD